MKGLGGKASRANLTLLSGFRLEILSMGKSLEQTESVKLNTLTILQGDFNYADYSCMYMLNY